MPRTPLVESALCTAGEWTRGSNLRSLLLEASSVFFNTSRLCAQGAPQTARRARFGVAKRRSEASKKLGLILLAGTCLRDTHDTPFPLVHPPQIPFSQCPSWTLGCVPHGKVPGFPSPNLAPLRTDPAPVLARSLQHPSPYVSTPQSRTMQDLFQGQFAVLSSLQYPFLCQLYPSPPVPGSLHSPPKGSGALTSRPTAPQYLFPEWLLLGAPHPDCPLPRRHPLAPPDNKGSGVPGGGREARRMETGRGNRARSQETQTYSSSSSSYIARSRNHTSQKRFKFSVTQCSPPKVLTPRGQSLSAVQCATLLESPPRATTPGAVDRRLVPSPWVFSA